ncbi:DUF6988 family protein [Candidatus Marinarcus aquaticus]|uniref:Uncharacterized protein n=1 Tax=Candidatus Marinarcus aquaticus TaxID=2044504 RepID=A0A4Q0XTP4_9BACT|nr:hypothetical protein [Candidatus Marinarcus aquaticus]RXJ58176.1 hypothetical protein CRV04_06620 [Candidatus Marinarcus aquaticus]
MNITTYIETSKQIEDEITHVLAGRTCNSERESIVAGYLSLVQQHHKAIRVLIANGLYSSAFALGRPMLEALYRGTWLGVAATDDEVEAFNRNKEFSFKSQYILAKAIDEVIGDDTFYTVLEENATLLNSMTHGGMEQIGRQFNETGNVIESSFKEEELFELLSNAHANMGMMLLTFNIFQQDLALESLAKQLLE